MTRVFVYGTLRRGDYNHYILKESTFLGTANTEPRFTLVNLGVFPAMINKGNTSIRGEVYEVDDSTLRTLDSLEGHPNYYVRGKIQLQNGMEANAYVLPNRRADFHPTIPSGDWFDVKSNIPV